LAILGTEFGADKLTLGVAASRSFATLSPPAPPGNTPPRE
jgi:hypothetical protein